ncbi:unnamed protein product [Ilex paraguariensis]|uniref:Amidase domain-containing protein n=1 Tax=Ilex paraguariensis TaxID=185542 RepID=A0ABC8S900_9AQUA
MIKEFGQDIFLAAEATDGIGDAEKKALLKLAILTQAGFVKLMVENKLDALVTAGSDVAPVLAIGGFPGISVPAAYDINSKGVPVALSLSEWSLAFKSHELSIREATVQDLQKAFKQNQLTSRQLVEFYIKEINKLNPVLKGIIEVNPDALCQAEQADQEREVKSPRSLSGLHGIPILLKDNIATKDKLNTTSGSLALLGSVVPRDAGVVMKLRNAGAIILGRLA